MLDFKRSKARYLSVISLLLVSLVVWAGDFYFKHIEMADNLSNNQVNAILKDSKGYLWFGTASGLNRWDGYTMKTFMSDSRNAKSLPDNYIESIQEARDGALWIRTGGGYAIYDPHTEDFDREISTTLTKMGIQGNPQNIRIDRSRNIWVNVKNDGIYYYKPGMQLVYEFTFNDQQQGLPEGDIVCLDECREGMVLCYSNGRLVCVNGEKRKIVWQEDYIPNNGGQRNDDYHAFADRKDNLWVWNNSNLYIYKKSSNTWVNSLSELAAQWKTTAPNFTDNRVRCIAQDPKGVLWIATENSGIIVVNPNEGSIKEVRANLENERSLPTDNIQSLFIDNTGVVWVGASKYGVSYYADGIFKFNVDWLGDITALAQDASGNLWMGTSEHGIIYKDAKSGETRNFTRHSDGLSSNYISSLVVHGNRVWAASPRGGVDYLENGKVGHLGPGEDGTNLLTNNVQTLCTDAHGNLWIGTQGFGLQCWNVNTGNYTTYDVASKHLRSDNVMDITKSGGNLLIATSAGLTVMQIENRKCKTYVGNNKGDTSFPSTSVTCAIGDSRGLYWAGTREGLVIYSPKSDQMALLGKDAGLDNELILAITEDVQKNMWVTTAAGVSQIVVQADSKEQYPYSFHVYNYNRKDGLQSAEFNPNAILSAQDGKLYIGGMSGVNWLYPTQTETHKVKERLFFTQLFIDDVEIKIGEKYKGKLILPSALSTLNSINIPHGVDFVIKLASDCYNLPEKLQYAYKLDGVDDNWRTGDAAFHGLSYSSLSSGTYLLHVKAISSAGSSEETTLIITIAPPVWLSWWAFLGYALIFVLLFVWWAFWRPRKNAQKSRLKNLEQKEQRLKEMAEDFRVPVTTMIPPLNALVEDELDEKKREYLTTVHFQAMQIMALANKLQKYFGNEQMKDKLEPVRVVVAEQQKLEHTATESSPETDNAIIRHQILLVDDNPEFLDFMKLSLEDKFDVIIAENGDFAWDKITHEKPSLIVCENDMQGMTGSELCSKLKSSKDLDRIPFMLMTDSASAAMIGDNGINNRITTSADDYIAKPFNVQVLVARINKLLGIEVLTHDLSDVEYEESAIESEAISATMDEQLRINAEQFVLQNISRTTLSVEEMAKAMNMSRAHLYKKLTAITGKTPIEFIRIVRLKQAALLLRQGTYNVSEVAYEIGFNNPKNFSKYFKDEYGVSPSQFISEKR